ncbi:MAG TPA: YCF48-related protein [Candidatus Acidoferrum sp.]|nr:YCF48-related protein [Candidatus Acidoferrum sp.]
MQMKKALIALAMCATVFALCSTAQTWRQVGPPGGTVISLAADPNNISKLYLGTADGHVFTSSDEGGHWQLISRIGTGQDDVITHIIVDRRDGKRLYASTWSLYSGGGGVYRSDDSGQTWNIIGLAHETVRALAQSPNDPKLFLAGSLSGVYRSVDEGASWERITPAGHEDLRNFDSVAFDPKDDNIIYAGTYHLPWKTSNGGKDWFPVVKGMIDDSDVMSIIVDPANPDNVHATACSGIYHSTNGGTQWIKYQGIPSVFRRTQLIRMDPTNESVFYAGTTSGLWKTVNDKDFKRVSPGDWIINALIIDPKNPQKLIIGTERQGVQISNDGGNTFTAANSGFQHQHISDVAMDREHPERALVVLTFDNDAFLATKDGGSSWTTLGPGLKRTEMRHVYAAPNGWWASLTNGGWMKYEENAHKWVRTGLYVPDAAAPVGATSKKGANSKAKAPVARTSTPQLAAFLVNDMSFGNDTWFAATAGGVLASKDFGATWKSAGKDSLVRKPSQSVEVASDGNQVWAIAERNLLYSTDKGATWEAKELSFAAAGNLRLNRLDDTTLFITTNMGLYASRDAGRNWSRQEVRDLSFQSAAGSSNALVVSLQKRGLIASFDGGKSWQHMDDQLSQGYFPVVRSRRDGSVVAVSATEGILSLDPNAKSASTSSGSGMR